MDEKDIQAIVAQVLANIQLHDEPAEKRLGIFDDMNDAIAAAIEAQKVMQKMPMDFRERIISNIRRLTIENAELLARMGVEETGMGNVGDKILKHKLLAEKTPGTEDITTRVWSGDRGLTLIEMGPFGVIGAITPTTNPSETNLCNSIGMIAGGNTVVFNPPPAAIRTSQFAIELVNRASLEAGGPNNVATSVVKPTMDTSKIMMSHKAIQLIAATGGPGVVTTVPGASCSLQGKGAWAWELLRPYFSAASFHGLKYFSSSSPSASNTGTCRFSVISR